MNKTPTLNETVRESIALALLQLMEQKPFLDISVSEIVRTAGVSRSSFYRNFDSREQVLCLYLRDLYRDYFSGKGAQSEEGDDYKQFLLPRFRFIRLHKELFTTLHRQGMLGYVFERMEPDLIRLLCGQRSTLTRYHLAMSAGACASILRMWIDNDLQESEEEMVDIFAAMKF